MIACPIWQLSRLPRGFDTYLIGGDRGDVICRQIEIGRKAIHS